MEMNKVTTDKTSASAQKVEADGSTSISRGTFQLKKEQQLLYLWKHTHTLVSLGGQYEECREYIHQFWRLDFNSSSCSC